MKLTARPFRSVPTAAFVCAAFMLSGCVSDGAETPAPLAAPAKFSSGGSPEVGGLEAWAGRFGSKEFARLVAALRSASAALEVTSQIGPNPA